MTGLLAYLGTQITSVGRNAERLSQNPRRSANVEAAADAALHTAIFHLLDYSQTSWPADGVAHMIRLPGAVAEAGSIDVAGMLQPEHRIRFPS